MSQALLPSKDDAPASQYHANECESWSNDSTRSIIKTQDSTYQYKYRPIRLLYHHLWPIEQAFTIISGSVTASPYQFNNFRLEYLSYNVHLKSSLTGSLIP